MFHKPLMQECIPRAYLSKLIIRRGETDLVQELLAHRARPAGAEKDAKILESFGQKARLKVSAKFN